MEVKSAQISATTDRMPRFCKFSSFLKINFKHSEVDKSVEFSIIQQIKHQLIYLFKCIFLRSFPLGNKKLNPSSIFEIFLTRPKTVLNFVLGIPNETR